VFGTGVGGGNAVIDEDARLFQSRMQQRRSDGYLRFFAPVTSRFLEPLAALAGSGDGCLALDLGCGDGMLSDVLAGRGWRCVGIDRSRPMAQLAAARPGGGPTVVADALALPVRTGAVDVVASAFLVPHLDDLAGAFREMRRVLRPGGRVLLATWGPPDRSPFTGLALELIREHSGPDRDRLFQDLVSRTTAERLGSLLRSAGFVEVVSRLVVTAVRPGSPQDWWNGLVRGSFGLSLLLHGCPPAARPAVREEFLRRAARHAVRDQVRTEAEAVVLAAVAR
jgi:SAM-dependent methyltransferase